MKKKILHIQVLPKLSGVQKISLEIFKNLSDDEYEKWIFFSADMDEDNKNICTKAFEAVGTKVVFSQRLRREISFRDFPAFWEIYRLCKKERFDIVHTNSTKPGIIGRIAATFAGIPLVIHTVHGLSFHDFTKFPKWQFYWFCEMLASIFCHKIVLVNQYYKKHFKWFDGKVTTIHNSLDFSEFPDTQSIEREKSPAKILFVGRLDEQKDPITLLQAAKKVIKTAPQTLFTLVGDGSKYDECKLFIGQNNLENNVFLEGWKTDVLKYYPTHDIFCSSSIYEAFGLIFLEAGYYGLPVVTTNVEGISEVVINEHTGLLSAPKDADKLAENILKLLKNNKLRKDYGENAKKWVTTQFAIDKMVKEYAKMYKNT